MRKFNEEEDLNELEPDMDSDDETKAKMNVLQDIMNMADDSENEQISPSERQTDVESFADSDSIKDGGGGGKGGGMGDMDMLKKLKGGMGGGM